MATNKTTFVLEADQAQAVQSFLRVVDAQKKTEKGFERVVHSGIRADKAMARMAGNLKSSLGSWATGLVSIGTVTAGLNEYIQTLKAYSAEARSFEKEMTPLFSLGDNADQMERLRDQVLAMSNAYGTARSEIAATMFNLQSSTGNLDKSVQDQILRSALQFKQLTGTELPTSLLLLSKAYQIYREELGSVARTQDKVFAIGEKGALTFEEMAALLPDVLPAAKAMGNSFDDVAAALITATQYGGKTEKTFTGVRNVFLRMNKAEEEGIQLTGQFVDKLRQLQDVDPNTLKRIFGDEAISTIAVLTERMNEVAANLKAMRELPAGQVEGRILRKAGDPLYQYGIMSEVMQQSIKNQPVQDRGWIEQHGVDEIRNQMTARGFKAGNAAWKHFLVGDEDPNLGQRVARWWLQASGPRGESAYDLGRQLTLDEMRQQGRGNEADYWALATGEKLYDPNRGFQQFYNVRTNQEDAERYIRLRRQYGSTMNLNRFTKLLGYERAAADDSDPRQEQLRDLRGLRNFMAELEASAQKMKEAADTQKEAAAEQSRRQVNYANPAQRE